MSLWGSLGSYEDLGSSGGGGSEVSLGPWEASMGLWGLSVGFRGVHMGFCGLPWGFGISLWDLWRI